MRRDLANDTQRVYLYCICAVLFSTALSALGFSLLVAAESILEARFYSGDPWTKFHSVCATYVLAPPWIAFVVAWGGALVGVVVAYLIDRRS